jgi:hypothetical protein
MFANACTIARKYTFPIIISHQKANGECGSGIGTFVIINEEGWFVTAFHIIEMLQRFQESNKQYKELLEKRKKIEHDATLIHPIKKKQLSGLKIDPNYIDKFSIWLGWDGLTLGEVHAIPEIDLAVGRLINFDKTTVTVYPQFKDATKPMDQGTSLCKLGFPFHSIKPTFEDGKGFVLPPGSLPIPIFPIEGIYTRTVHIPTQKDFTIPLMYIETSSPGLRGQSGGPTFDVHGTIWAIQSQTQHLKLGFGDNQKPSKETEHLKHQYLNVGWGIHAQTITTLLKDRNINFQVSAY